MTLLKPLLLTLTLLFPVLLLSPHNSLVTTVARSMVRVEFGDLGGQHPICTGFVVNIKQAVTARHCVPAEGEAVYVDGQEAKVVKLNERFALLELPNVGKPPLSLRARKVEVQEEVVAFGLGYGEFLVLTRHIAGFLEQDLILDNTLAPGMSGGPVVDAAGEVVGLNQASNFVIGIACPTAEITEFLASKGSK